MASSKEIRTKIKSVESTRKITKAMEMVAASKMRKAQDRMRSARPYSEKIRQVASNLAYALTDYRHSFIVARDEVKNVGVILVTTDKGLAGGLNTNVARVLFTQMRQWESEGKAVCVSAIGSKGVGFVSRAGVALRSQVVGLGDQPKLEQLIGAVQTMVQAYVSGEVDQVYLCFTRFVNTMKQEPVCEQLLPLPKEHLTSTKSSSGGWDYLYEPDPKSVIDDLLQRYIEALVYQAVAENLASEQSARMVAMKAASDNALTVISDLKLAYNKARQSAITQELAEIVGGAAAV